MGIDVELVEGVGPVVDEPIDSARGRRAAPGRRAGGVGRADPRGGAARARRARARARARRLLRRRRSPSRATSSRASRAATSSRTKTLMYREPAIWHALMERLDRAVRALRRGAGGAPAPTRSSSSTPGSACSRSTDYGEFVAPVLGARARRRPTCRRSTSAQERRRTCSPRWRPPAGRRRRRLAHPARRRAGRPSGRSGRSRATSSRPCCSARGIASSAAALDVLRRARRPRRATSSTSATASCRRPIRTCSRGSTELVQEQRLGGMKSAVVLMAYGSPERLADVPAYYADIRGGRPIAPEHLADLVERYRRLGIEDSSPLNAITEQTRAALEAELGLPVFTGMKHWTPRIADAAESAVSHGGRGDRRPRARAALLRALDRRLPRAARARARRPRGAPLRRELARRAGLRRAARRPRARHRRACRLHGALAAGADPRGGRPVPRPAARDRRASSPRRRA